MGRLIPHLLLSLSLSASALAQQAVLYAPFDESSEALGIAGRQPNSFNAPFPRPELVYEKGINGKGAIVGPIAMLSPDIPHMQVQFPVSPHLNRKRGSLLFWCKRLKDGEDFKPEFQPVGTNFLSARHAALVEPATRDRDWHHYALVWDEDAIKIGFHFDGELVDEQKMLIPIAGKMLTFGGTSSCVVDEVYVFDQAISEGDLDNALARGRSGKRWLSGRKLPRPQATVLPWQNTRHDSSRPPLPIKVSRDIRDRVIQSPKRLRQRFSLEGFWRIQPVTGDDFSPGSQGWYYLRAPGHWKGRETDLFDDNLRPIQPPASFADASAVWLEREFDLPVEEKRRYRIVLQGVRSAGSGDYESDVYFNGTFLGSLFAHEERSYEVTSFVKAKGNLIQIMNGRPWGDTALSGLSGGAWLEACPDQPVLFEGPVFGKAAVKEKMLGVEYTLNARKTKEYQLLCRAQHTDGLGGEVWLGPQPVPAAEKGMTTSWFQWNNVIPWQPTEPMRLQLSLLLRKGEQDIDETFPITTGFRELGTSGDTLFLNGTPIRLRGNSLSHLPEDPGSFIRENQELGFNTIDLSNRFRVDEGEAFLQRSDAQGMLVLYPLGPAPRAVLNGPNWKHAERYFRARMDRLANHPSLILWKLDDYGHVSGPWGHPASIAGLSPPDQKAPAVKASQLLHELDPSRPNFYARYGDGGDILSAYQSFNAGVPIQTREEWPRVWASARNKPLLVRTPGPMPFKTFFLWQRGEEDNPAFAEHAATWFGSQAYRRTNAMDALTFSKTAQHSAAYWSRHPLYDEVKAMGIERQLKAWRGMGLSYVIDFQREDAQNLLPRTEAALKRQNKPFFAFIAGPAEDYLRKDTAYFAGEKVERQLVISNDTEEPVGMMVEIEWLLGAGIGNSSTRDKRGISVQPGEIAFIPLVYQCPAVQDKTRVKLLVTGKVLGAESDLLNFEEELGLHIFPRFNFPRNLNTQRILVLDPDTHLSKVLSDENVSFDTLKEESDLSNYNLLLIGRGSANPDWMRVLEANGFRKAVQKGLNVVFFEQGYSHLLGLQVETFDHRQAFVRAPNSPLLQGLDDSDFTNWRGNSTMGTAYPGFDPDGDWTQHEFMKHGVMNGLGQRRFWHWSNLGMVASFCFRKPDRGNFKVLLDCGFDQLYTPLLEYRHGQGRMLFCQLDITGRYGLDPVATLLTQRILAEYSKPMSAEVLPTMLVSGEIGKQTLEVLGFPYDQLNDFAEDELDTTRPLFVDLRERKQLSRAEFLRIQEFVAGGGKLLQMGAISNEDAGWLPGEMQFQLRDVFRSEILEHSLLDGLGDTDFFWRMPRKMSVVLRTPPRGTIMKSGVIAVIPFGRGNAILCQFDPRMFRDPWQRTKSMRVLSTLFTNLGALCTVGPWLPEDKGEETVGPYTTPAIEFDPAEHYLLSNE
ncbi:MAG: hypothetical protein O3B01_29580 [Planctomycetota bacterium]|nr:hypothetical protein [Planctomycetota bacterium]